MPRDIGYRHRLAQLMDRSGQPPGYSQVRVKQLQVFDADSLAMGTQQLAVLASQPDLSVGQVQIPYRALGPAVDAGSLLPSQMTYGLKALVRGDIDKRF